MTTARYDEIAEWYDSLVRGWPDGLEPVASTVLKMAGDLAGRRVCDLGCGQGFLARRMAQLGASVVGVDISEKLLQIAERDEAAVSLGIEYLNDDANGLSRLADGAFDGVVCNWALLDIADLDACLRAVERVLRPGGWFVFSITHPCFLTRDFSWESEAKETSVDHLVRSYFREGFSPPGVGGGIRGRVGRHYRTLGTYLNTVTGAGLVLERIIESQCDVGRTDPLGTPPFLVVRGRKPATSCPE